MGNAITLNAGGGIMIIWVVAMIALIYFMMIRPQKKEQKRINQMLGSMAVGDSVVTTSGFYGVILDITDEDVIVEFGNNKNCRIPMRKAAIAQVEKAQAVATASTEKVEKKDNE
ncbi:MAG: preprotein translocase subunit YajC [Lachnospiraceae bacterium]|nr:preprotein translocase subunit YajC [Lachnospiraceae bacterium]